MFLRRYCPTPPPLLDQGAVQNLRKIADRSRARKHEWPNLAASLARPVVRGFLPLADAEAALAVAIIRQEKAGTSPGAGTFDDKLRIGCDILDLHLRDEVARRKRASGAITLALRPLIGIHAPRNRLLAEAHDANADAGSPLSEPEVEKVAKIQVYWSMQGRRPHAGR